jgi:hypothetical protein
VEEYFGDIFQSSKKVGSLETSASMIREWWAAAQDPGSVPSADEVAIKRFAVRQERFRRLAFFRRNSWKFALGAVGLALIGIIGGTALSNVLRPLRTLGMGPEQVAAAFYSGVNALDGELVKDCVAGDAGKDMVGMVDNLYVISQIRAGTERRNVRLPASEWLEAGSPPIDPNLMLFGIGNLILAPSLESVDQGDSRHFVARYDIFSAESTANASKAQTDVAHLIVTAIHREDRLTLRLGDRGTWQIVDIKRKETAPPTTFDVPRP